MGHLCDYFLGTTFSNIRSFNREFKTKVFVEGNLSFVEASWQPFTRTNRSPQSPFFNCRNGLLQSSHFLIQLGITLAWCNCKKTRGLSKEERKVFLLQILLPLELQYSHD